MHLPYELLVVPTSAVVSSRATSAGCYSDPFSTVAIGVLLSGKRIRLPPNDGEAGREIFMVRLIEESFNC